MKRVGQLLKDAREGAGMTQQDVARVSGFSAAYVSQVESGKRAEPSFRSIAKLCAALAVSLDFIANELGFQTPGRAPKVTPHDRRRTLVEIRRLEARLKQVVQAISELADRVERG